MEYENIRVMELKALARDRGLRNYSRMRKAELVALLQNNPLPLQRTLEPVLCDAGAWEPMDDDMKSRVPTQQEMDIFEQQEMNTIWPRVKNKLNKWCDWLINHVPKPIRDGASKAFKTFKNKIVGLYNRAGNEMRLKGPTPLKPIELEHAFNGSYRSYRIGGKPRMDVDTFFYRIRKELIGLIKRELKTQTSARVQMMAWIRFVLADKSQERVELAFNSLMTSVYQGSERDQIVGGMVDDMKFEIENPALLNSRFVFDEVLYLDVNFHQLNLSRGSSYLPLPDWLARKGAIVNPHNDDEECFKWSVIVAENIGMKDPK